MSDFKEILKRKSQVIQRCLEGTDGDAFIALLEDTFQTSVFDKDPGRMAYNAGQYELVEYLKQLRSNNHE